MESHERADAACALDLVAASRAGLADRLVTPAWYHPVCGLLFGAFACAYVAGSTPVRLLALAVLLAGTLLLVRAYRSATGVWVSGWRAGAATRWARALGVVLAVCLLGGLALYRGLDWRPAPVVAGLVVLVATVALGRRFDETLRADLRSQLPVRP